MLNYRLIGFSFPPARHPGDYKIEIAAGIYNREDSFEKNKIQTVPGEKNKIIAEVPSFGSQYTWRVVYTGDNAKITSSGFHHFSTMAAACADTNLERLRVIKGAGKYKDTYVFLEATGALYDMAGRVVWFLPPVLVAPNTHATDLKLSPQGTITFLLNDNIYEINYNGDVL